MSGITGTNGKQYSAWNTLAQGITIQQEKEQNQQKLDRQIKNTWGNSEALALIKQKSESSPEKPKSLMEKQIKAGLQPQKKDKWDKIVSHYLNGIKLHEFEAYPYHNNSYNKKGTHAVKEKTKAEGKVLNNVIGKTVTLQELFATYGQAKEAGAEFDNDIQNQNNHLLPVEEIFKHYDELKLVKATYGKDQLSFYIPCKATWENNQKYQYGILEVTLNPKSDKKNQIGKPNHVYFKEIHMSKGTASYLSKTYKDDSPKLLQLLEQLEGNNCQTVRLNNGENGSVILLKS